MFIVLKTRLAVAFFSRQSAACLPFVGHLLGIDPSACAASEPVDPVDPQPTLRSDLRSDLRSNLRSPVDTEADCFVRRKVRGKSTSNARFPIIKIRRRSIFYRPAVCRSTNLRRLLNSSWSNETPIIGVDYGRYRSAGLITPVGHRSLRRV